MHDREGQVTTYMTGEGQVAAYMTGSIRVKAYTRMSG